jgi:hypothetical protein
MPLAAMRPTSLPWPLSDPAIDRTIETFGDRNGRDVPRWAGRDTDLDMREFLPTPAR